MTFEDVMKDEKQREKIREQLSFLNAKEMSGLKDNPLISEEMFVLMESLKKSIPDSLRKNEGMYRVGMIEGLNRLSYFKTMPESIAVSVNANGVAIENELWGLVEQMKTPQFAASQIAGNIVKEAYGVQPVLVTNWPNDALQNAANIAETGAALYFFGKEIAALLPRLTGGAISLRALLGLGAAEAAGGAALAETTVAGGAAAGGVIGPTALGLPFFFGGGYAIGTEVNKGLGALLGIEDKPGTKWYEGGFGGRLGETHHDIRSNGGYLDNAAYFYGRNVVGPVNKWMESVSPKVGGIIFRNLGFGVGDMPEGTCPNPIRNYAAPPDGIGENVSGIFRRERMVRVENIPPQVKNENKMHMLINIYEDGKTYAETDGNLEMKVDVRRGYMD